MKFQDKLSEHLFVQLRLSDDRKGGVSELGNKCRRLAIEVWGFAAMSNPQVIKRKNIKIIGKIFINNEQLLKI